MIESDEIKVEKSKMGTKYMIDEIGVRRGKKQEEKYGWESGQKGTDSKGDGREETVGKGTGGNDEGGREEKASILGEDSASIPLIREFHFF